MEIAQDIKNAVSILVGAGAFVPNIPMTYASGRTGNAKVDLYRVLHDPFRMAVIGDVLAKFFHDDRIEAVVGPGPEGAIISQWVAQTINRWRLAAININPRQASQFSAEEIPAMFYEAQAPAPTSMGGPMRQRYLPPRNSGFARLTKSKRTLVVAGAIDLGTEIREVVERVREIGGEVIGVSAICNHSGLVADDLTVLKLSSIIDIAVTGGERKKQSA